MVRHMECNAKAYSVIIPAYNEAGAIIQTISEIRRHGQDFEIIVVDDGSEDNTLELAQSTGVKVLRHSQNRGYGASLKKGIQEAIYNTIVITDADGTYPNQRIPELVDTFHNDQHDMVVGARTSDHVKIPLIRRPAKWVLTRMANYLVNKEIPDLNSGFRVMRKDLIEKYINMLCDGFSFTSTITLCMLTNNYNVKYVPIDYYERSGRSKIRPIVDTLNFVQLIIRTAMYFEPLRIFVPLSFFIFLLSVAVLTGSHFYLGKAMDVTFGVLFMGAIIILSIGMLADLIDKRLK
jgi:glycosyltransferase involved in cell wall biosynthesis